ncbi:hypothetical protein BJ875DRAFT_283735 [Amylocarpus encephaloides]|uniref:CFEM domain-containing protein n=1 Tax=Amylocarpus encephaloides TaxID=45428 RepID=A0A9P7YJQ6_9HELO|nr:hypothetical protein BJ875DRAFT_283735 [Amylocarpus encephaloides]
MYFSIVALSAILASSFAIAQTPASLVAQVPPCAFECLLSAVLSVGCSQTDYTCICGTGKDAIQEFAVPCVVRGCSTTEALLTQRLAAQVCEMVGQPLKSKYSSSSTAVKSTTGSSGSPSSSSSRAVTSVVTPSVTASTSIPITEAMSMSTSLATSTSSPAGSVTGTSPVTTNATSSASYNSSPDPYPRIRATGLIIVAGLLAAFLL